MKQTLRIPVTLFFLSLMAILVYLGNKMLQFHKEFEQSLIGDAVTVIVYAIGTAFCIIGICVTWQKNQSNHVNKINNGKEQ